MMLRRGMESLSRRGEDRMEVMRYDRRRRGVGINESGGSVSEAVDSVIGGDIDNVLAPVAEE